MNSGYKIRVTKADLVNLLGLDVQQGWHMGEFHIEGGSCVIDVVRTDGEKLNLKNGWVAPWSPPLMPLCMCDLRDVVAGTLEEAREYRAHEFKR